MPDRLLPFAIGLAVIFGVLAVALVIWMIVRSYNHSVRQSYSKLSDRDLLLFADGQLDKIVDKRLVAETFGLTKTEAARRLSLLYHNGIFSILYNRSMTGMSYTLIKPIDKDHNITLSDEPFMTLEDLLMICKHYDYQVTLQELCLATGLPIKVVKREMKNFEKQNIVKMMLQMHSQSIYQRRYLLNEPYRSDPERFLELKNVNFELKEIYEKLSKNDFV